MSEQQPTGQCEYCQKQCKKRCKCQGVFYCCEEHQKLHWSVHKLTCSASKKNGNTTVSPAPAQSSTQKTARENQQNLQNIPPEGNSVNGNISQTQSANNNPLSQISQEKSQYMLNQQQQAFQIQQQALIKEKQQLQMQLQQQIAQNQQMMHINLLNNSNANNITSTQRSMSSNKTAIDSLSNSGVGMTISNLNPLGINSSNSSNIFLTNVPGIQQALSSNNKDQQQMSPLNRISSRNILANNQTLSGNSNLKKDNERTYVSSQEMITIKEERMKLRTEVVHYLAKFEYNEAVTPVSNLVSKSEQIYNQPPKKFSELYELLADQLLRVKILIKTNQTKLACSRLKDVFDTIKLKLDNESLNLLHQQTLSSDSQSKNYNDIEKKNQLMNEIKKRCNLISLVANLFYSLGYPKDCEEAYVKYIKLIESIFGPDALETSNCYFLIGVYYLQHRYYVKALACFKRSMSIRTQKLTEKHESVTDCMYNIGIIYKQMGKKQKAYDQLEKTLYKRRQVIGESSLPVAQTLEILGKIYIEVNDYKIALSKFQECYSIRKSIIQNNKHPDMVRISLLLVHLYNMIRTQIQVFQAQESSESKQALALMDLEKEMQKNTIDNNIAYYIQTQKNASDKSNEFQEQIDMQGVEQSLSGGSQTILSNQSNQQSNNTNNSGRNQGKQSITVQMQDQGIGQGKVSRQNQGRSSVVTRGNNLGRGSEVQKNISNSRESFSENGGLYENNISNNFSKKRVDQRRVPEESDEDDEDENENELSEVDDVRVNRRSPVQSKNYLKINESILGPITLGQSEDLLALNKQIKQEMKINPFFNPKNLIMSSNFINSINEMHFQEIYRHIVEQNPEFFQDDDEDLKLQAESTAATPPGPRAYDRRQLSTSQTLFQDTQGAGNGNGLLSFQNQNSQSGSQIQSTNQNQNQQQMLSSKGSFGPLSGSKNLMTSQQIDHPDQGMQIDMRRSTFQKMKTPEQLIKESSPTKVHFAQ